MNEPYRLRYTNQIVGVFLLIVFVISLAVSVLLFSRLAVTRDRFMITTTEEEAINLRTGTEVVVLGQTIGEVEALRYADEGDEVEVTLAIDSDYRDQITSDSEVTLNRKFGVGAPVLTIRRRQRSVTEQPAVALNPGDSLGKFQGDVDPVEKLAAEVQSASNSIDTAAQTMTSSMNETIDPTFKQGDSAFRSWRETSEALRPASLQTLTQVRNTTEKLESEITALTETVHQLVQNDIRQTVAGVKQSAEAATNAAQSVSETAETIEFNTEKTNQDIAATLETLRETAKLIQQLTNETRAVVQIVRSEAEELPGTTERVNATVGDTQELVGDIRQHWLLRRFREEPGPTRQVSPSAIRGGGAR